MRSVDEDIRILAAKKSGGPGVNLSLYAIDWCGEVFAFIAAYDNIKDENGAYIVNESGQSPGVEFFDVRTRWVLHDEKSGTTYRSPAVMDADTYDGLVGIAVDLYFHDRRTRTRPPILRVTLDKSEPSPTKVFLVGTDAGHPGAGG